MFTSGLSTAGFALLDGMGPRPLAQVMGASVHQIGFEYLAAPDYTIEPTPFQHNYSQTLIEELEVIAGAWDHARRAALDRMTDQAIAAGADAVVGVTLVRSQDDDDTVQYSVNGTAIATPGSDGKRWPVLTDLSVQDYWRLWQAGYEPTGLVAATAVIFVSPGRGTRFARWRTFTANQELPELGQALFAGWDAVRARLLSQARSNRGEGMVGVELEHHQREGEFAFGRTGLVPKSLWTSLRQELGVRRYDDHATDVEREGIVVTVHGAGTAIRRAVDVPPHAPEQIVRLNPRS